MKKFLILGLSLMLALSGCLTNSARIKGGSLEHRASTGTLTVQKQSEDPKDRSNLETGSEKTYEVMLPAGSRIQLESAVYSKDAPLSNSVTTVTLSSNSLFRATIKDSVRSTFGGAQKNVIGETIAKLGSLKWVTWVGMLLFLFGVASLFWPPLKLIIGSATTSMAAIAGGVLLIILPVIVVGHELLILGIIGGGVTLYFFAHRYGGMSSKVKVLQGFIDKNNNKIDDRLENTEKDV